MLKVWFIRKEARFEDGCYVVDFWADDGGTHYWGNAEKEYCGYRGMHYAFQNLNFPLVRKSAIYVVCQHDLWRTLRVLAHELTHAFIWLFHLPEKWSRRLDGQEDR